MYVCMNYVPEVHLGEWHELCMLKCMLRYISCLIVGISHGKIIIKRSGIKHLKHTKQPCKINSPRSLHETLTKQLV